MADPLHQQDFETLVHLAPLVAVDFLAYDQEGRVLLGKRRGAPAKGLWCVPGGRIRKNEAVMAAVVRKLQEELRIDAPSSLRWHGVFEHFLPDSSFDEALSTHYVALVFGFDFHEGKTLDPCPQHDELRFFEPSEVLRRDDVLESVKNYFRGDFLDQLLRPSHGLLEAR